MKYGMNLYDGMSSKTISAGRPTASFPLWPDSPIAQAAPDQCYSCGFLMRIAGPLADYFGVCANGDANDDGRVVTFDHGCGAHSEVDIEKQEPVSIGEPLIDEVAYDLV